MTAAAILAALAAVCLAAAIVELAAHRAGRGTRGEDAEGEGPSGLRPGGGAPARPAVAARRPLARRAALALSAAGRRRNGRAAPADLERRLVAAGRPFGLSAADVMALKGGGTVAGLLLASLMAAGLSGRLALVALLCAPAAGHLFPDLLLARHTRRRAERMARELADVLDLLRVAVQAGLPVGRALAEVGRRHPGLVAGELRAASARLELGEPRAVALASLAARCPVESAQALVAAIARADRHGSPLAPALEALATEARADQARRLRDEAARAAPKIQLVVALVLVPAVMLLVAAALVQALAPSGL